MKNNAKHFLLGKNVFWLIGKPFVFHVVIWCAVLVILSVLTSVNGNWPYGFYFLLLLSALPALALFSYLMDWLANRLMFNSGRSVLFLFLFLLGTIVFSLLIPLLHHWIFFGLFYPRVIEPTPWFNWRFIPQNLILLWFPYFLFAIRSFFLHWFRSEQEKLIIENKRLLAEIQLMKIKLHPHFLFNTLNNLYAMSKKDCKNASDYILKLAEIYRTMLYECNRDFFPVNSELKLIRNYIDLEKIRYDKRLTLELSIIETLPDHVMVPPLVFFSLIENAFKHGCRNDIGAPYIKLKIGEDKDCLIYQSENSVPDTETTHGEFGGFGLENNIKRMNLVFKNEYEFQYGRKGKSYVVFLKIPKLTMS